MRIKKIICHFLLLISLSVPSVFSADREIIETVVNPFFRALQNGDVETVGSLIADPLYSQVKVLLNDNKEYPDFLRNYYLDSHIEIINIYDYPPEHKKVYLELYLSDEKQLIELQLHKSASGDWKVTKQSEMSVSSF